MSLHVIWDLDGTLIDSSEIIVDELINACNKLNIKIVETQVKETLTKESTSQYIENLEKRFGLEKNVVKDEFSSRLLKRNGDLKLKDEAFEVLQYLNSLGVNNYICTNKGKNTHLILKELGIYDFFEEIITSEDVKEKKPSPEGINMILKKCGLDPVNTLYIGDKPADAKAAECAKVKSINLNVPTNKNNQKINSLCEIKTIINEALA